MVDEHAIFSFAGAKIRAMREHLGWTAQELADRAGYSRGHITQIEGGKPAAVAAMARIAHALGIPLADLLAEQRDQCRIDLGRVDLDWWVGDCQLTDDEKQDLARIAKRFSTKDEPR